MTSLSLNSTAERSIKIRNKKNNNDKKEKYYPISIEIVWGKSLLCLIVSFAPLSVLFCILFQCHSLWAFCSILMNSSLILFIQNNNNYYMKITLYFYDIDYIYILLASHVNTKTTTTNHPNLVNIHTSVLKNRSYHPILLHFCRC